MGKLAKCEIRKIFIKSRLKWKKMIKKPLETLKTLESFCCPTLKIVGADQNFPHFKNSIEPLALNNK